MNYRSLFLACLVGAITASGGHAAITFFGPSTGNGQGFGNDGHNLLTLQAGNANSSDEWGSVLWNGTADQFVNPRPSGDVDTNDLKTKTATSAGLKALGIDKDSFGLLFDINQGGSGKVITVNDFDLVFFNGAGSEQFRLKFDAMGGLKLDDVNGGSGDFDYLFEVKFDNTLQATNFFTNDSWRVGMEITEANAMVTAASGAETFTLKQTEIFIPPPAVPEPAAMVVWSVLGTLGLACGHWRKRKS